VLAVAGRTADTSESSARHLLPVVHKNYFNSEHEAFRQQTLWSLANAFTSAFKELWTIRQFQATPRLGTFLESFNGARSFS
jgi:hypothetical protein